MIKYYTVIIMLTVFAMFIMQVCVAKSNSLTFTRKKIFYFLFNTIIVAALCEWGGILLEQEGESTRIIHIILKVIEFSIAPIIAFLVAFIIEKKSSKIIFAFLSLNAIIEILSGIFGFIFTVDKNGHYSHEKFYFIYVIVYILSIIYCLIIVIKNMKKFQYNGLHFFILLIIFLLAGIIIQLYDSNLKVDYVTLGLDAIMLYVFTIETITQTDGLTELLNRRGYDSYINHIEETCIVCFLDIDRFKMINDTHGHLYGDHVLKRVGKAIKENYGKYGKCFRFGGDEFCIIIKKKLNEIENINKGFLKLINNEIEKDTKFPSISMGYASFNPLSQSIQDTIAEADQMMYKNKNEKKLNTL